MRESQKNRVIKTIIADDHPIFIEGVKLLLKKHPMLKFSLVGELRDGNGILKLVEETQAELLLLDLNMPNKDGIAVLEEVEQKGLKNLKIIVLTMYDDDKVVQSAFKAGAYGYLLKKNDMGELSVAIESVMAGKVFVGKYVSTLTAGAGNFVENNYADHFSQKYRLTRREKEILKLISKALNNKQIASQLYISDQTVSVHRKNIMRKMKVSSTAELIKIVYNYSLV